MELPRAALEHSPAVSAVSVRLLQAAADVLGGNEALAQRLDIEKWLLAAYLADRRELPDALLLRAVDIVIAGRVLNPGLPGVTRVTENDDRGIRPATPTDGGGA